MDHTRGAAFRLHLAHDWPHAPDVLFAGGGPGIGRFTHRRRRRDRVNGDYFVRLVSNVSRCLIAIDRDPLLHVGIPSQWCSNKLVSANPSPQKTNETNVAA